MPISSDVGRRSGRRSRRLLVSASLATLTVVPLVAAAGCGSSKPEYCTARSNLEQAVKDLPNSVTSGGASGLKAQVATIQTDANAAVESAKSDFPSQTAALKSSVEALTTAVQGMPSSPSASDLAPVALDATAVISAVKGFTNATKSECD